MIKFSRIVAAITALLIIVMSLGCGSPTVAGNYVSEDKSFELEVNTGIYLCAMLESYEQAKDKVQDYTISMFAKGQSIDGKPTEQWIIDEATSKVKQFIYLNKMFKELELEAPKDEIQNFRDQIDSFYDDTSSPYRRYKDNGISKDSLVQYYSVWSFYSQALLKALYGEGGSKAVSDEELKKYYDDKYVKVQFMALPLTDSEGEKLSQDKINEIKNKFQGYSDRINKGESFTTVYKDYDKWQEEFLFRINDPEGEFKPKEREPDPDYSKMSDEEIEKDIQSKGYESFFPKDAGEQGQLPIAMMNTINHLEPGKSALYTDDSYYYLFKKVEMFERPSFFNVNRESILFEAKSEDFSEHLKEEGDKLDFTIDPKVIEKNKPSKIIIKSPTSAY